MHHQPRCGRIVPAQAPAALARLSASTPLGQRRRRHVAGPSSWSRRRTCLGICGASRETRAIAVAPPRSDCPAPALHDGRHARTPVTELERPSGAEFAVQASFDTGDRRDATLSTDPGRQRPRCCTGAARTRYGRRHGGGSGRIVGERPRVGWTVQPARDPEQLRAAAPSARRAPAGASRPTAQPESAPRCQELRAAGTRGRVAARPPPSDGPKSHARAPPRSDGLGFACVRTRENGSAVPHHEPARSARCREDTRALRRSGDRPDRRPLGRTWRSARPASGAASPSVSEVRGAGRDVPRPIRRGVDKRLVQRLQRRRRARRTSADAAHQNSSAISTITGVSTSAGRKFPTFTSLRSSSFSEIPMIRIPPALVSASSVSPVEHRRRRRPRRG